MEAICLHQKVSKEEERSRAIEIFSASKLPMPTGSWTPIPSS
jgi:hypothetical protein